MKRFVRVLTEDEREAVEFARQETTSSDYGKETVGLHGKVYTKQEQVESRELRADDSLRNPESLECDKRFTTPHEHSISIRGQRARLFKSR